MITPVTMLQTFTMSNIVNHKEDVVTYSKTIRLTYITEVKFQQSTQPNLLLLAKYKSPHAFSIIKTSMRACFMRLNLNYMWHRYMVHW